MTIHYTIIEDPEKTCPEWDHFVLNHPCGHRMQTSIWAETKAQTGWKIHCLTASNENGALLGGAQLYERQLPIIGSLVCLPKGPLASPQKPELVPELIAKTKQWAKETHRFCLLVQPADNCHDLCRHLLNERFVKLADENIIPPGTIIIDLSEDTETLFHNLKRAKRRNVCRAKEEGIIVKEGGIEDLDAFYTLYQNTSCYLDFDPIEKSRVEELWNTLAPHGYMRLFMSTYAGQPLSAMLVLCFGCTFTCWRFGWSKEYSEKRPNDALYWESILWAKEHGFRYFDFGEIELDAARKICGEETVPIEYHYSSVYFKLGFGGKPVLNPETYLYFTVNFFRWLFVNILYPLINLPLTQKMIMSMAG